MTLDFYWCTKGNLHVFTAIANAKNVNSLFMNSDLFDGMLTQDQADALADIDHVESLTIESEAQYTTRSDLSPYLEPILNKLTKLNLLEMDTILLKHLSMERFQPYQLNLKSLHLFTFTTDDYDDDTEEFFFEVVSEFLQQLVLPKIETLEIDEFRHDKPSKLRRTQNRNIVQRMRCSNRINFILFFYFIQKLLP